MADRNSKTAGTDGWRAAYQAGMRPGGEDCPGDEALAGLVLDELRDAEREAVAGHVVLCRRCADNYRTLRALHATAREGRPRRGAGKAVLAAAAGLAAVLAVALVWLPRTPAPDDPAGTVRNAGVGQLAQPPDGAVLATSPQRLAWPAQPGATAYSARLHDAAGEPLWEGPWAPSAAVELPPDVRQRMRPGGAYFWIVTVEGIAVRRLGPYWFQLQPR